MAAINFILNKLDIMAILFTFPQIVELTDNVRKTLNGAVTRKHKLEGVDEDRSMVTDLTSDKPRGVPP
jgi:hypothetical protein